jgi:hypothetical protein
MIKLTRLPLPPSINGLYTSARGRLIKSSEGRIYDQKMQVYKLRNFKLIDEITNEFKDCCLKVDRYFVLHKKRVFCKNGDIKKIDPTNFIKAQDDCLSKIIGIDDRYFKSGVCELMTCEHEKDEQAIVYIEKFMIKEYDGVM